MNLTRATSTMLMSQNVNPRDEQVFVMSIKLYKLSFSELILSFRNSYIVPISQTPLGHSYKIYVRINATENSNALIRRPLVRLDVGLLYHTTSKTKRELGISFV